VEGLIDELTRGNVTEVKVVLSTVIVALVVYQLVLAAVSYGKVRPGFLAAGPATWAHRAVGDTVLVLAVGVAIACLTTTASRREAPMRSSAAWSWRRWR
jgi:Family of unknown function (DUF6529)